jgi:hypothetical protein
MTKQVKLKVAEAFEPRMDEDVAERVQINAFNAKALREQLAEEEMQTIDKFGEAVRNLDWRMSELMPLGYHDVADWHTATYGAFYSLDGHEILKQDSERLRWFWKSLQENLYICTEFSEGERSDFKMSETWTISRAECRYRHAFDASVSEYEAKHLDHYGISREGLEVTS